VIDEIKARQGAGLGATARHAAAAMMSTARLLRLGDEKIVSHCAGIARQGGVRATRWQAAEYNGLADALSSVLWLDGDDVVHEIGVGAEGAG
jgi:hypothetical protein